MLAPAPATAAPYGHLYNSGSPDNPTCTHDELCKIAKEDAWHDHGSIKGLDSFKTAAKHLKQPCEGPVKNEDIFMFQRVLAAPTMPANHILAKPIANITDITDITTSDGSPVFERISDDNENIHKINNEFYNDLNIQPGRYSVFNISSHEPDETPGVIATTAASSDTRVSLIQKLFQCLNITDDVYFIRDVAYGNFADDIYNWSQEGDQTATFLITSQGQYDPGPTVTCLTDAGVRIGMGHYLGDSEKRNKLAGNRNVRFGMYDIDVESERVTKYPIYPVDLQSITGSRDNYPPQAMMSTKFESYMVSEISYDNKIGLPKVTFGDVDTILSSSNTTLFILDPTDEISKNSLKGKVAATFGYTPTKNIFTIDKNTSNKATTLDSITRKISTKISGVGITNFPNLPFDSAIYDVLYTSEEICKILSKKFGDHSQSIKTIDPVISYIEFNCLRNNPISPDFTLSRKKSSGVHVFVTYDRVAATAAIEYGAPIVLFNNHDGFLIYISINLIKKYSTPESIVYAKLQYYKDTYDKYLHDNTAEGNLSHIRVIVVDLKQKVTTIMNNIIAILNAVNTPDITDDQKYADFLKIYYVLSPILSILSDFDKFSNSVIQNITDFDDSKLSTVYDLSSHSYIQRVNDATKSNKQNDKKWIDDNIADMKSKYDTNDLIYKQYLNCIASEKKLRSIYGLLLFRIRSVSEKLVARHITKPKKNDDTLRTFIELLQDNQASDDKFFDTVFTSDDSFAYGFMQCLPYINALVDQDTLTELSKITPTSTLAIDRFSRLFTSCITNAGGAIPSLGIPIVKLVHKTLAGALRETFETKINKYLNVVKSKTHAAKQPIYKTMVDNFYAETSFSQQVVTELGEGLIGGKKTVVFNRSHNKSIHKSNKKTRKNKKIQKNKKLIKGGQLYEITLNRDKLVVSMLFYEYGIVLNTNYAQIISKQGLDKLTELCKNFVDIAIKITDPVEKIIREKTQFLPPVFLTEEFASAYKIDYLFENLTDEGKIYYKLTQLVIYIIETLIINLTTPGADTFQQIETEITNFISELRKDFAEGKFINYIIDIFIAMKTSARHNRLDSLLSNIYTLLYVIANFIESLVILSPYTYDIQEYAHTVEYLLPTDIVKHILQNPVPINEIIAKILHQQISAGPSVSTQDLIPQIDILPYGVEPISGYFANMSFGDFTQVLSLGSSDEGRALLILENYFFTIPNLQRAITLYKSNRISDIGTAITYIFSHFGDEFFSTYFPTMTNFYNYIRNFKEIKSDIINAINVLPNIDAQIFIDRIERADTFEHTVQIAEEATQFSQAVSGAIDTINGLLYIDRKEFIEELKQAGTVEYIGQIVKDAHTESELLTSQHDAHEIINGLYNLADGERNAAIINLDKAHNVDMVNRVVVDAINMNDNIDREVSYRRRKQNTKYLPLYQRQTPEQQEALEQIKKLQVKYHSAQERFNKLPTRFNRSEDRERTERAKKLIKKNMREINNQIQQIRGDNDIVVGGNKTRKNRKQITYKYTKKHTNRLRKTRKITKLPKYIKKNVTKHRR